MACGARLMKFFPFALSQGEGTCDPFAGLAAFRHTFSFSGCRHIALPRVGESEPSIATVPRYDDLPPDYGLIECISFSVMISGGPLANDIAFPMNSVKCGVDPCVLRASISL